MITSEQQVEILQQQIADLRAQSRERDTFLSKALHNLRNQLTLVIGYNSYVSKNYTDVLDEVAGNLLNEADEIGFKMNRLLEAISIIVQVRNTTLNITPLDMEQVIYSAQNQLRPLIISSNAQITFPTQWPTAMGDANFIAKVWFNFLSNALKHGDQPPHITITALPISDQMARFSVEDHGPGLSEEDKMLMFSPFPGIRPVEEDFAGVGLYTARIIITQFGGTVSVESELGYGSIFSFTLPLKQ